MAPYCWSRPEVGGSFAGLAATPWAWSLSPSSTVVAGANVVFGDRFANPCERGAFELGAPTFPPESEKGQAVRAENYSGFVRYFVAQDAKFEPLKFSAEKFRDRLLELSQLFDATR